MSRKRFISGRFVRISLSDDSYGYGRLRELPIVSFYDFQTKKPISDLDEISSKPILFTVGIHKSVLAKWEVIGKRPLEQIMLEPFWEFWQDLGDFRNCKIFDTKGNERSAEPAECVGLERWAVWEAEGVEERLLDAFMGRTNPHVEHMKVRFKDHPNVKPKPNV